MMDDPNITMEEYIKLQAEKAQIRGRMFNWETSTYDKSYCDDLDFFIDFEADYPAIVYNDALTSNENVPSKPTIWLFHLEIRDNSTLGSRGFTDLMAEGLSGRMPMEHKDAQGQSVFTSRAWSWALQLHLCGVRVRMSWREFILGICLHTTEEIKTAGFDAYWAEIARQIPDKGLMTSNNVYL
ncbi:hypothetical protein Tco_1372343 [Tanacetum coccineum]